MKKVFVTARDIEDMARRGEMRLALVDNLVITDYARERARDLGVELVRAGKGREEERKGGRQGSQETGKQGSGGAGGQGGTGAGTEAPVQSLVSNLQSPSDAELARRVKAAVLARVGPGVDEALLDRIIPTIIRRVRNGG